MKFLFLILFSASAFAGINEQVSTFNEIIDGQGTALDKISEKENTSHGFKFTDMITDIGISKSGILGLSALKSSNSMELRWKRKVVAAPLVENTEMIVPAETDSDDLDHLSDTIASLVEKSGKVNNTQNIRPQIKNALSQVNEQIAAIQVTALNGWKFSAVRLDLNFSASGSVSFIATAGAALRVRLEWQVKNKPLTSGVALNEQTKTVTKILADLNTAGKRVLIPGFEIKRLMLGFGSSIKKKFGLWKYSAGFTGAMIFVPVPVPPSLTSVPAEVVDTKIDINGFEEEVVSADKLRFPWRRQYSVPVDFSKGLEQSIRMATNFVEHANKANFKHWYISDIRTINDISKTGIFGFADVTAKGLLEIEHKRINQ
jgi:hypothetical protein